MEITTDLLLTVCRNLSPEVAATLATAIDSACAEFLVNTLERQAMFLAQITEESGEFTAVRENLNYSAEALLGLWPRHFTSDAAHQYGRVPGQHAADQEAIANIVYGGKYGNNNPGDGWLYRGGGFLQTTFKDNYIAAAQALNVDLVSNPELITDPVISARAAGFFWYAHGCNEAADVGDFVAVTRIVNGGTINQARREQYWVAYKTVMGIA